MRPLSHKVIPLQPRIIESIKIESINDSLYYKHQNLESHCLIFCLSFWLHPLSLHSKGLNIYVLCVLDVRQKLECIFIYLGLYFLPV